MGIFDSLKAIWKKLGINGRVKNFSASIPNASASGLQVVENPEIKHNESLRGKATDLIYRFGEFFEFWDASRDLGNGMA